MAEAMKLKAAVKSTQTITKLKPSVLQIDFAAVCCVILLEVEEEVFTRSGVKLKQLPVNSGHSTSLIQ